MGVGPLIPTVQGLVDGLPVVGGPVGGLVRTVDNTVGLTDLLNKPKSKRDLLDGLIGGGAAGGGAAGGAASSATGALGGLTSGLGGLTSGLPLGALGGADSTINGLLGQLQGAGASSSQLAGVLGQLQGLGLGSLPLSALTGTASSTASNLQNQASTVTPSAANIQQATQILQGLTVAEAEKYGLLPSGTTSKLLTQIETAAAAQSANTNNLASSFSSRTYGFKAQPGSNETTTEDQGGATPTFSIASPEAVASAIQAGGVAPMSSGSSSTEPSPSTTSAAEMSKRTGIPSSSSSMTPAASSTSKPSASSPNPDSMEDSGSDYSDEEDDEDSDLDEEPVTPTSASSTLARRGGPLEDSTPESEMEEKKKEKTTHGDMEGQGPNASSGTWHATESSSMAQTQSQAVATAEAVSSFFSSIFSSVSPGLY